MKNISYVSFVTTCKLCHTCHQEYFINVNKYGNMGIAMYCDEWTEIAMK